MSNLPIFDIAGSALQAQSVRLSTIASNLANADSVAGSPEASARFTPGDASWYWVVGGPSRGDMCTLSARTSQATGRAPAEKPR